MPAAIHTNSNSSNFSTQILKIFLEKCSEASEMPLETIKDLWESELKVEARKTFTLIPLELYEDLVFKGLQNMTNSFTNLNSQNIKRQRAKNGSKGSLRKSLTGSGSIGSIGSRIRSLSLIDYDDIDIKVTKFI